VKLKDEKQYGEYRTKRVIMEMYDEMQRAMEMRVDIHAYANKGGITNL